MLYSVSAFPKRGILEVFFSVGPFWCRNWIQCFQSRYKCRCLGFFSVSLLRIFYQEKEQTSHKSKFSCLLCTPEERRGSPCSLLTPDTSHGNPIESCSSPGSRCGCHPAELLGTSSGVLTSPCPLCGHQVPDGVPDVGATPGRAPVPSPALLSAAMETGEGKTGLDWTPWILDWDTHPTWEELKRERKAWGVEQEWFIPL